MTIDYDLFREKLNALNGEIFKMTNEQQVLPVLAIHEILKECEVEEMTDKINSEDFIKAFGGGVKQVENVKPIEITKEEIRDKMFFINEEDSDQPIVVIKVADLLEKEVKKNDK